MQCRYKTSVLGCYTVPTSYSWNSIQLVMRLLTLTFECFFFVFAIQWYYGQSSKLFSELAFEDFLCLYFRVTRRFMLRMQRELNKFTQIFIIHTVYANLNEPLLIYPDCSNCTKFKRSCFNYPKLIEAVGMFLIVSKFQWSACILPKFEWSYLELPKVE